MQNKAFSLIELMVVISIMGILSAVALPAYRDYTLKSKVGTTLSILPDLRDKVVEYYNENLDFPRQPSHLGLTESGTYSGGSGSSIKSSDYNSKYITGVTVSGDSQKTYMRIMLNPSEIPLPDKSQANIFVGFTVEGNTMVMLCGQFQPANTTDSVQMKYLPSSCRDAAAW